MKSTSSVDEQPRMRQQTVTTSKERIEGIWDKLAPHMAQNKRIFWEQLLSESRKRPAGSNGACKSAKRRSSSASGCTSQPRRKQAR